MAVEDVRFQDLGQIVVDLLPQDARHILLYTEFDDGVIWPSLFYELDGQIHFVFSNDVLARELVRLGEILGADVIALAFEIKGDSFTTHFSYTDTFDAEEDISLRIDAALRNAFGHANTLYPSL